jgi:magnesium transporter
MMKARRLIKPKRTSDKAGMPPESLVFVGEQKIEKPVITVFQYNAEHSDDREYTLEEALNVQTTPDKITWFNIEGLHDVELVHKLCDKFSVPALLIEDILNTSERPKVDIIGDVLFIVLRMLWKDEKSESIITEHMSIVLGKDFILAFQEGILGDVFQPIRTRLRTGRGKLRKQKIDYLCYELMDAIVDSYFGILETLGDKIEVLEEDVLVQPQTELLRQLHDLRSDLLNVRRSVWPLRDIINNIQRDDDTYFQKSTGFYLRDLYDHTVQELETIETYWELLSGLQDIYLSSISNRMNEIMKVLTIITTIFIPLSFIAGVYGMNFKYMPELDSRYGYPIVILVMLIISFIMIRIFIKKKWM